MTIRSSNQIFEILRAKEHNDYLKLTVPEALSLVEECVVELYDHNRGSGLYGHKETRKNASMIAAELASVSDLPALIIVKCCWNNTYVVIDGNSRLVMLKDNLAPFEETDTLGFQVKHVETQSAFHSLYSRLGNRVSKHSLQQTLHKTDNTMSEAIRRFGMTTCVSDFGGSEEKLGSFHLLIAQFASALCTQNYKIGKVFSLNLVDKARCEVNSDLRSSESAMLGKKYQAIFDEVSERGDLHAAICDVVELMDEALLDQYRKEDRVPRENRTPPLTRQLTVFSLLLFTRFMKPEMFSANGQRKYLAMTILSPEHLKIDTIQSKHRFQSSFDTLCSVVETKISRSVGNRKKKKQLSLAHLSLAH